MKYHTDSACQGLIRLAENHNMLKPHQEWKRRYLFAVTQAILNEGSDHMAASLAEAMQYVFHHGLKACIREQKASGYQYAAIAAARTMQIMQATRKVLAQQ